MIETRYHPLVDCNTEGTEKAPMFMIADGDEVSRVHQMYLSEMIPNYYRLYSREQMSQRATDKINIHCPLCGSVLRQIARNCDGNKLGLYTCDKCKKYI